jgi:hypothetical protein
MALQPRKRVYHWQERADHGSFHFGHRAGRCIAYPVPVDERDLWYSVRTGEIYIIAGVENAIEDSAKLGDFVLEQTFPMEIAPAGSPVYALPLYGCVEDWEPGTDVCTPWTPPEPECPVALPDVPAPAEGGALPDKLPRPELPPAYEPGHGGTLEWL